MSIKKKRIRIRAKREYGITHSCDLCEKGNATTMALVEGERLALCNGCKKFGRFLFSLDLAEHQNPEELKKGREPLEEIVENYSTLIRNKRQQAGVSIETLAQRLQERKSYLQKIERGDLLPSLQTAKKLQGALGIKLIHNSE